MSSSKRTLLAEKKIERENEQDAADGCSMVRAAYRLMIIGFFFLG
jgi:hypothetical protein